MTICKCPHCGGTINPASLLASIPSEARVAASKKNGAKSKGRPRTADRVLLISPSGKLLYEDIRSRLGHIRAARVKFQPCVMRLNSPDGERLEWGEDGSLIKSYEE